MQKINLIYNINYQLIVCIEHNYCVLISSLEHHLRFKHELKGNRLHVALTKTNTLKIKKSKQAQASIDAFAIPHLAIEFEFRCEILACKLCTLFVNKNKRTIEKHLSKEYNVNHAKSKTKLISSNIEEI